MLRTLVPSLGVLIGTLAATQPSYAGLFDFITNNQYPHHKSRSITNAINASVWSTAQGKPYLELVSEQTRLRNPGPASGPVVPVSPCSLADLQKVSSDGIHCILMLPNIEGCESNKCFRISPPAGLLENKAYRDAVIRAVENPCDYVTDPAVLKATYNLKYHVVYGMVYPAEYTWTSLQCGERNPVKGELVMQEGNTLLINIK